MHLLLQLSLTTFTPTDLQRDLSGGASATTQAFISSLKTTKTHSTRKKKHFDNTNLLNTKINPELISDVVQILTHNMVASFGYAT